MTSRMFFNKNIKRLTRKSYSVKNEIRIGCKVVAMVRIDYDMDLTQTMCIDGRISGYYIGDDNTLYINLSNCHYSQSLNGRNIHTSSIRKANNLSIDYNTIISLTYIIEKC